MEDRIRQLEQEREKLLAEARKLIEAAEAEERGLTNEEAEKYDRLVDEIEKITGRLDVLNREARLNSMIGKLSAVMLDGPEARNTRVNPEYRTAWERYIRFGEFDVRALGKSTGSAGGYLVPDELADEVVKSLTDYAAVLNAARVLRTTHGRNIPIPTTDESGVKGAVVAENALIAEQDVTLGQKILGAHKFTSKLVRVSNELLEDSAFDIAELLRDLFGDRIGRALNEKLTVGTGTGEPEGIVTAATNTVTAATLDYDALVDIMSGVNRAYAPRSVWMFSTKTFGKILKLKDTNGLPVFSPNDDRILGFPYVINDDLPDHGTVGQKGAIVFGDLSRYYVRVVRDASVKRLDERYADYDQTGFVAFLRADGVLTDAKAVAVSQE